MSVAYKIQAQDGSTADIPASKVISDLQSKGIDASLTADGRNVHYTIDNQAMEMPVADLITKMVAPVIGVTFDPASTDFTKIDTGLRMGIENFPNDRLRQKYLELQLEAKGIENPQVFGKGSDWAMWNPVTAKYEALTNKEGMDLSDLGMVAAEAPRLVGSIAGGALGGAAPLAAGPAGILGSVAAGATGSAVGGQAGRLLVDAYLGATQPGYRETLAQLSEEDLTDVLKERAGQVGLDVAGGALGGGIALIPGLGQGLVTRAGSTVSNALAGTGGLVKRVGGAAAESPLAKSLAPEFVGGLGGTQLAAFVAQGPAYLGKNLPNWSKWLANRMGQPQVAEELASLGASQAARDAATKSTDKVLRNYQTLFGGPAFQKAVPTGQPTASNVFEDVGKRLGTRVDKWAADRRLRKEIARENAFASGNIYGGMTDDAAARAAQRAASQAAAADASEELARNIAKQNFATEFANIGRRVGTVAEGVGAAGATGLKALETTAGLGFRGLQGLGYGVEKLGQAGKIGFGALQPLEYRLGAAAGSRLAEDQLFGGR